MNALVGLLGFVAMVFWVVQPGHHDGFTGFVHVPALVLVGAGPLSLLLISFKPDDLWSATLTLFRALNTSANQSRQALFEELNKFSEELRAHRPHAALEIARSSAAPLLRQLGPLVVRQHDAESVHRAAVTAAAVDASQLRRAESVFTSLARSAPAVGLVGTVLGLVLLLKDLADFQRLGPSMALAMLCTFYGLLLANAVYQPLARRIAVLATLRAEEARLIARGLAVAHDDRAAAELRALFDAPLPTSVAPAPSTLAGGGA